MSPATWQQPDPREPLAALRKDLGTGQQGLASREAARRLTSYGPNEVRGQQGPSLAAEIVRQLVHPLALLLWIAAGLAYVAHTATLMVAIVAVIVLNATFAVVQERQAERAVEALGRYLPQRASVRRDAAERVVEAAQLAPGDLIVLREGDRVPADARLVTGALEIDMSALTGESLPVERVTVPPDPHIPLLRARDLVFSGTTCVSGEAEGLVFATGAHTELGRVAALSQRLKREESPLEHQIRRVAWLIPAGSGRSRGFVSPSRLDCRAPVRGLRKHRDEFARHLDEDVVLVCQSGGRATQAGHTLADTGLSSLRVLRGGMSVWEQSGAPVTRGRPRWDLERQVRLVAGSLVVAATVGSIIMVPVKWVAAFVGAGLAFAAVSNTCAMADLVSKLPYNRGPGCDVDAVVAELGGAQAQGDSEGRC